jgi:hypothetical protein
MLKLLPKSLRYNVARTSIEPHHPYGLVTGKLGCCHVGLAKTHLPVLFWQAIVLVKRETEVYSECIEKSGARVSGR